MNGSKPETIKGPFGRFIRQENDLIYFYKEDGIRIDKSTAEKFLDIVRALDDSGRAKVIVIQGKQVEYTFDAQRLLLTNDFLGGIAYVTQTRGQYLVARLLQDLAKTLRSNFQVGVFRDMEDAENWYLNQPVSLSITQAAASRRDDINFSAVMYSF
jgi:hypothetical protein